MTIQLDLLDIQGHVLRAYGGFGYMVSRYVFFNITNPRHMVDSEGVEGYSEIHNNARQFVSEITQRVTTAAEWGDGPNQVPKPNCAINIAFTYQGLKNLGVPRASLIGFPPEFADGMKARKDILGDDGPSAPENWDPIWQGNRQEREKDVHIFIGLNALTPEYLEEGYQWILEVLNRYRDSIALLVGHRGDNGELLDYQDGHVLFENGRPTPKEHFGYTDGISDPVFAGVPYDTNRVKGRGKQMSDGTWAPLATGEFLLGQIDEAREYPPAPQPVSLSRNGTYMVYRKLHENVGTFEQYLEEQGAKYPGGKELLAAKFVGRWRDNGAPLVRAPDAESKARFDAELEAAKEAKDFQKIDDLLSDFTYDDDMSGGKCPFSAHIRRFNPRASLEMTHEPGDLPGSLKVCKDAFDTPGALANRRRILRRGLPYGKVENRNSDNGNHGIIIMLLNADIERQFEFVQQQWINYGNDFRAGNDKEIILGNHGGDDLFPSKAVLQVEPDSKEAPFILPKLPRFVETRGGDYFFMPSMTALRLIAQGVIDPT